MPYVVHDPALLEERVAGGPHQSGRHSSVGAELPYLSAITKTGSAPLPEDARTTIPAAAGVQLLQAGDTVPDTPLIDQDGKPISLKDYRGSAVAVSFIYTRVSVGSVLPRSSIGASRKVQKLAAGNAALAGKVRLLGDQLRSRVRVSPPRCGRMPGKWRRSHRLDVRNRRRSGGPIGWPRHSASTSSVRRTARSPTTCGPR
jgi:hypothetical protein